MSRKNQTFENIKYFSKRVRDKYTQSSNSVVNKNNKTLNLRNPSNEDDNKSFRRKSSSTLLSTQQLPVDNSDFTKHTFFASAEVKTNVAFDKIINNYPFDGSYAEVESFEDSLSSFERYVLEKFPKSTGFLNFDSQKAQRIVVKDKSGHMNQSLVRGAARESYLNPEDSSFSIECHFRIPDTSTEKCFLFDSLDSSSKVGYAAYFESSDISDEECTINFLISSGSSEYRNISTRVKKGVWQNLNFICNKSSSNNFTEISTGSISLVTSSFFRFGNLKEIKSELMIADGRDILVGNGGNEFSFNRTSTFSGSIDEFRIFHQLRSKSEVDYFQKRNLFANKNLRLLLRFNEPSGDYSSKDVVLDHSGKSLHTRIQNYSDEMRTPAGVSSPMNLEDPIHNPVLFPDHPEVVSLNSSLLENASLYDINNPNLITKLIPSHYLEEGAYDSGTSVSGDIVELYNGVGGLPKSGKIGSSQLISLFLYFMAEELDRYKMYIDQVSELVHSSYDDKSGVADPFLKDLANQYGLELPSIFGNSSAEQFLSRENLGIEFGTYEKSLSSIQNLIWRRILKNINYINKSKGTLRAIKSIFRSSGIEPDRLFRFVEFNGVKEFRLGRSRQEITEFSTMLNFSGSASELKDYFLDESQTPPVRVSRQREDGTFIDRPLLVSTPLSSSRIEPGIPELKGGNSLATGTIKFHSTDLTATPAIDSKITIQDAYNNTKVFQFRNDNNAGNNIAVNINGLNTIQALNQLTSSIKSAFPNSFDITTLFSTPGSNRDTVSLTTKGFNRSNLGNHQISLADASNLEVDGFSGGNGFILAGVQGYENAGISPNENDGLLTSGSWTLEGIYEFPSSLDKSKFRSVSRLGVKGLTDGENWKDKYGIVTNLVISPQGNKISLLVRNDYRTQAPLIVTELTGADFYNGRKWYISFGRERNDIKGHPVSSSFFIKAAQLNDGEPGEVISSRVAVRESVTSGVFNPEKNIFQNQTPDGVEKFSGSQVLIGSQSFLLPESNYFLNGVTGQYASLAKQSYFDGRVTQIKFWSKSLSDSETQSHITNFKSVGVDNPLKNFTFENSATGSFEKLRLNISTDQIDLKSDANGSLLLTDFSQNFSSGGTCFDFEKNKTIVEQERFDYSIISPFFDEYLGNDKIKIAAFSNASNVITYNTTTSPVTELLPFQKEVLDNRFEIQMHLQRGLDEDIMNIFSTIDALDDAIGRPELLFSTDYPDIRRMRNLYFNRLTDKVNYKNFFDLFRWIDDAFSTMVEKFIPRNTRFLGINLIIESHALERYKIAYGHSDIYIGEDERDNLRSVLLVSQRSGVIKRF